MCYFHFRSVVVMLGRLNKINVAVITKREEFKIINMVLKCISPINL